MTHGDGSRGLFLEFDVMTNSSYLYKIQNPRPCVYLFFLEAVETLTKRLEAKYNVYKSKGGYLNERQKTIMAFVREHQPVKVGDIVKFFPDFSVNTIKKDLFYMKNEQLLTTVGIGKGTVYIFPD